MKGQQLRAFWQSCADFFASRTAAMEQCRGFADWEKHTQREWELEYDFLFRGTDADWPIPLWASTSKEEQVLCNQTTLEVIRFYHRYGFEPEYVEGNPPDYIGEQFRFLAYLEGAVDRGLQRQQRQEQQGADFVGGSVHGMDKAVEDFIQYYVLDTVKMICDEVRKRGTFAGFEQYLMRMLERVAGAASAEDATGVIGAAGAADVAGATGVANTVAEVAEVAEAAGAADATVEVADTAGAADATADRADISEVADSIAVVAASELAPAIADAPAQIIPTAGINNCGGICVIRPKVQEGCMLSIDTDQCSEHAPQLRACVRGRGYRKTFLNSGRLRYPMKRIGERGSGKFERISWEEAVELMTENWIRIRDTYGPGSRYVNYGFGVTGIMLPGRLTKRLLSLDGGYLDYYGSYSSACVRYVSPYIFGSNECGNSPADLLNTKLLILWGDNPAETIFGPERNYYLSKLKELGVRIIVVDPRMSQTAVTYADEWIALRPSTDSALVDAMAYVIWSEHLQNQAFMDRYCLGFDEAHMPEGIPDGESYHSYLFGKKDGIAKTPEWAEPITGVDAETIRRIARAYATTKPACIVSGLGPQRHGNGEQTVRSVCVLPCMTGNLGIAGGGSGGNGNIREHEEIGLFTNQVKNPYEPKIPMFLWTKAIEHGTEMTAKEDRIDGGERLDSNIRMLFNLAGNVLVNQHSDINDTIRILKDDSKCQFIVCSDIFMTPSARYADLLLPGTSVFEGTNIVPSWRGGNYLLRNNKVMEPLFESRFEWEWLKEIAAKLGLYEEYIEGKPTVEDWLRANYQILRERELELPDYEAFCAQGGWQFKEPVRYIAFEKEIADPKQHPFATPSGKIEIFSKRLYELQEEDVPAIPCYLPCPEGPEDPLRERYPLQLIGWHTRRRCHSIHDNNEWQEEIEKPGLWIHPEDAAKRGIRNGELVLIFNDRGRVKIPAIVTERIRTGVVAMSQGGWYTPDEEGTDVRGSINVLTSAAHPTPLAKGNPQHTNLVEVERV